jgi:hypothetical protein
MHRTATPSNDSLMATGRNIGNQLGGNTNTGLGLGDAGGAASMSESRLSLNTGINQ